MKEVDLIHKLENVEVPDVKLESHQRRLKMALLDAGYPKQQPSDAVRKLVKIKINGVTDTMIKALIARQPVWKTAVIGVLALALILGLSLTVPFGTESAYARAEEITQNSPEVKAALGGAEIEVVRIDIGEMTGQVLAKGETGSILAEVDLDANKVTKMATFVPDDQFVIEIARADARIQALLDAGATIGEVSTMYVFGQMGNVMTGEIEDISATLVMLTINGSPDSYVAYIDLAGGKVERLLKTIPMAPPTGSSESFSIPDLEFHGAASGEGD